MLTHVSEIKNNLGIDTGIVPKIYGYNMQKYEDRHQVWTHALVVRGSDKVAFNLRSSILKPGSVLSGTLVLNVSAYFHMLPNINGDDIAALDAVMHIWLKHLYD